MSVQGSVRRGVGVGGWGCVVTWVDRVDWRFGLFWTVASSGLSRGCSVDDCFVW